MEKMKNSEKEQGLPGPVPSSKQKFRSTPAILGGPPVRKKVLPYSRQKITSSDLKAVRQILKSDFLTTGPTGPRFGMAIASRTGFQHAVPVSSGTAALMVMLLSMENLKGREIITSPLTFSATSGAILLAGAIPVLADIDPVTFNVTPETVAPLITDRTAALLAVDYAGHPADWAGLRSLCDTRGIHLLLDCAHSLGATVESGLKAGSFAHGACFSFHPVKAVTCGEGGAFACSDTQWAEGAALLTNHCMKKFPQEESDPFHGRPWYYEIQGLGYNFRMDDISAALGLNQIRSLNTRIQEGREKAELLRKRLSAFSFLDLPVESSKALHTYHLFVARVKTSEQFPLSRDLLLNCLRAENITAQVHYIPIHHHPHYRDRVIHGSLPVCEQAYREIITLPCFDSMTSRDIRDIGQAMEKIALHSREILKASARV